VRKPLARRTCELTVSYDLVFWIMWSPVHVWVTVRKIGADHGNRLVDLACDLGAPLYNP
jgi:hypothetical protein